MSRIPEIALDNAIPAYIHHLEREVRRAKNELVDEFDAQQAAIEPVIELQLKEHLEQFAN